tara:strand:+ start:1471 stop:3993 length:2523 start_codon:yes stop_codon:yes gene_type:complete
MSRAAQKLISASGSKDVYEIEQSIMLDNTDDAHLEITPGSAGNQRTWTQSFWIKLNDYGDDYIGLYGFPGGSATSYYTGLPYFITDGNLNFLDNYGAGGYSGPYVTFATAVKDRSAWYHIVIIFDTTESTSTDRIKVFRNGVQCSAVTNTTYPSLNYQGSVNSTVLHTINQTQDGYYGSAQFAEYHFIDGTAKAASDFGETDTVTGQWIPKEYEGGSYGTNGFYLKFASGAIGTDSSGEGNNLTASNLGNEDVLLDTPTNNFPTVNSLEPWNTTVSALAQGNLNIKAATYSSGNYGNHFINFILPTSGKWYFEWLSGIQAGIGNQAQVGVSKQGPTGLLIPNKTQNPATFSSSTAMTMEISGDQAEIYDGGSSIDTDTGLTASSYVCAIAIDIDNNKFWGGYDNGSSITWMNSGDPAAGSNGAAHTFDSDSGIYATTTVNSGNTNRSYIIFNFGQNGTFCGYKTAGGNADGAGIGNFFYSPPSGFKALCTKNLPTPAVKKSSDHFDTVLYTGDNSNRNITSFNFQPDFLWLKSRESTYWHRLIDSVRGSTRSLHSDNNQVELVDDYGTVGGFLSNGFSLRAGTGSNANHNGTNASGDDMVAWAWKAGGSGSANTDGSINTTATSVNTTAGFSISTYQGTGSNATVGHGLGVAPSLIIIKNRDTNDNWRVYSRNDPTDYLAFNWDGASTDDNTSWNDTAPTSSVFSIGTDTNTNRSGDDFIAYCFAEVEGFSKFGMYESNNSTNGPYVYTGFTPAWIVFKYVDGSGEWWWMLDSTRDTINLTTEVLYVNATTVESTISGSGGVDFLSNGFKIRATNGGINFTNTYFYMAFAEFPFKYANAR